MDASKLRRTEESIAAVRARYPAASERQIVRRWLEALEADKTLKAAVVAELLTWQASELRARYCGAAASPALAAQAGRIDRA